VCEFACVCVCLFFFFLFFFSTFKQQPFLVLDLHLNSIITKIVSLIPFASLWHARNVTRSEKFCSLYMAKWAAARSENFGSLYTLKIMFQGLKLTGCLNRLVGCPERALRSLNSVFGTAVWIGGRPVRARLAEAENSILKLLLGLDQQLRSMSVCGLIELKLCKNVYDTRILIVNGGDWILSILYQCFEPVDSSLCILKPN
jgi:hypothetical protein